MQPLCSSSVWGSYGEVYAFRYGFDGACDAPRSCVGSKQQVIGIGSFISLFIARESTLVFDLPSQPSSSPFSGWSSSDLPLKITLTSRGPFRLHVSIQIVQESLGSVLSSNVHVTSRPTPARLVILWLCFLRAACPAYERGKTMPVNHNEDKGFEPAAGSDGQKSTFGTGIKRHYKRFWWVHITILIIVVLVVTLPL